MFCEIFKEVISKQVPEVRDQADVVCVKDAKERRDILRGIWRRHSSQA